MRQQQADSFQVIEMNFSPYVRDRALFKVRIRRSQLAGCPEQQGVPRPYPNLLQRLGRVLLKFHHHEAWLEAGRSLALGRSIVEIHACMSTGDDQGVFIWNPGPLISRLDLGHRQGQIHAAAARHS